MAAGKKIDCAEVIRELYGLTEPEATSIADAIKIELAARRAQGMTASQLAAIAAEKSDQVARALLVKEHQAMLRLAVKGRAMRYLARFDDPITALRSMLAGSEENVLNAQHSIDAIGKEIEANVLGHALIDLEDGHAGILKLFPNERFNTDLAHEMADGLLKGQSVTGNAEAFHVAKVFDKWKEVLRKMARKAGADVQRLPGHIMAQHHDILPIYKAGKNKWVQDTLPLLDAQRSFGTDDPVAALGRVYDNILTGRPSVLIEPEERALMPSNLANRMSRSRVLHFASPDAVLAYNKQYGGGRTVAEATLERFVSMSHEVALLENLGPSPQRMFDELLERQVRTATRQGKSVSGFSQQYTRNLYRAVSGADKIPGDPTFAKIGSSARAVQSWSKLGSSAISSVSDQATFGASAMYNGAGLFTGHAAGMKAMLQGRSTGERQMLGRMLGQYGEGVIGAVARRFSPTDMTPGAVSRITNSFFKWNGLNWITDVVKEGHSRFLSAHLAESLDLPYNQLHERLRDQLLRYGVSEADWGHIAANRSLLPEIEGARFLTPDSIQHMPGLNAAGKEKLERALRTYFVNEADIAVPTPGAKERAISLQGTQPGTVTGELLRSVWQFKMFPLTIITRVWPRAKAMGVPGVAQLAFASALFGYGAMTAKDLLRGKDPVDPLDLWREGNYAGATELVSRAMVQGGGAGIMGDVLFNDSTRYGRSLLEVTAGPSLGLINEVDKIRAAALKGDDTAGRAFKTLMNNMPYANLYYTKTAMDYFFIYQVQEALNPGYLQRMEKHVRRQSGQDWWLRPSDVVSRGGGFR